MAERIDNTGFGNMKVIQLEGIGYGVDAVLLAAFAAGETGAKAIRSGSVVADLGSGSGIIGFILHHKLENVEITGIDRREGAVSRASRAAELNGVADSYRFINADIKDLRPDRIYDAVVTNPPYFRRSSAVASSTDDKLIARHETSACFGDFMKTASAMLRKGGDCYIVHRPDRLADIFWEMRGCGIEPKTMQLVTPHSGEAANIVLIHGIKGAGRELKILPEIAVHDADGSYTDTIERIYERI